MDGPDAAARMACLLDRMGLTSSSPTKSHPNTSGDGQTAPADHEGADEMVQQLEKYAKLLDALATAHPQAHEAFVQAQADAAAALQEEHARSPGARFIVPEAAFVASTATVEAALRISEMEGTSSSARFVPLFVNFVGHDAVARPMVAPSARGAASTSDALVPVEEHQTWSAELDVHVPLLVGKPRVTTIPSNAEGEDGEGGRRAHAVDVVVNPWVVREAMKHRAFQAQVVALALEWVGEEAGLTLSAEAPCAVLSPALCPYWDGSVQGAKGVTPRPFVLDETVARQQLAPEKRPERSLQEPKSLLAAMREQPCSIQERRPPARRVRVVEIEDEGKDEQQEQQQQGQQQGQGQGRALPKKSHSSFQNGSVAGAGFMKRGFLLD